MAMKKKKKNPQLLKFLKALSRHLLAKEYHDHIFYEASTNENSVSFNQKIGIVNGSKKLKAEFVDFEIVESVTNSDQL